MARNGPRSVVSVPYRLRSMSRGEAVAERLSRGEGARIGQSTARADHEVSLFARHDRIYERRDLFCIIGAVTIDEHEDIGWSGRSVSQVDRSP